MPLRRKRFWIALLTGAAAILAISVSVVQTSTTAFCMSCHEMRPYQKEMDASPHAKDAEGRPISCSQCHVPNANLPRMLAAKAYLGALDVWAHFTGKGYDLDRAAMQPVARRFVDDANCRACHEDLARNAKNDGPVSPEGKLAHDAYLGKNGQARSGCAGCHANMAHLPVFDQRIPRNAKFLAKLKESQP